MTTVGRIIAGRYELRRLLGTGGMGTVYEAHHTITRRRVAVKILDAQAAASSSNVARFVKEAQAPSSIGHPNIVEVLDAGQDADGTLFIVLEYLDGVDLAAAMTLTTLGTDVVTHIGLVMLDALGAAHAGGYVHRDLKPHNVFLSRDEHGMLRVKLLDFGIARHSGEGAAPVHLTATGAVLGTPQYMSPEQARGERVDGRSDLWSLGATLFHVLAGRPPFLGDNYNVLIIAIATSRAPSLATLRSDLPSALVRAIDGALEPSLDRRWSTAAEMAACLAQATPTHAATTPFRYSLPGLPEIAHRTSSQGATPKTPAEAAMQPTIPATPTPVAPSNSTSTATPTPVPTGAWSATVIPHRTDRDDARRGDSAVAAHTDDPVAVDRAVTSPPRGTRWIAGAAIAAFVATGATVIAVRMASRTPRAAAGAGRDILPRPMSPPSGSTVANLQPTLRWWMPRRVEAVTVELCRDRTCVNVARRMYVSSDHARVDAELEPGAWYWRLRGLVAGRGTERTSAVFALVVRRTRAPTSASWGAVTDVDGDGRADLAVSAPRASNGMGRVALRRGTAQGTLGPLETALRGVDGDNGLFGAAMAFVGDVDGDGFGDVAVSAPEATNRTGRVHVYRGSAAGLRTRPWTLADSDDAEAHLGASLAGCVDVNGDGWADIVAGEPGLRDRTGAVAVFLGSGRGPRTPAALVLRGPDGVASEFGATVTSIGDVDGDGFGDIAIGAPGAMRESGRVYVHHGSATGLAVEPARVLDARDGPGGRFGASIAGVGDVNGDGYPDLAIAAPRAASGAGRVYVYAGGTSGLGASAVWSLAPPVDGDVRFGSAVAGGDLDGDGLDDVAIGADRANELRGRVDVYVGRAIGVPTTPSASFAQVVTETSRFGATLAIPGDLGGDSHADLVVGAYAAGADRGRTFVFTQSVPPGGALALEGQDGTSERFGWAILAP